MPPVARDLYQPAPDDVPPPAPPRARDTRAFERAHELLLGRELLLPHEPQERLLPMLLARELLHATASNTVPTRSPASSRSIASDRAATMAARQPAFDATRQASTLGNIPPSIVPSSTSDFAVSRSSSAITLPSFERTPGTSVTNTSSRAPR